MPRPKPPEPLKHRYMRMTDKQWVIFKHLGGADWLRAELEKKDPFPKQYYERLLNDNRNRESETGTKTQGARVR
jgi:hypothetical protein